MGAEIRVLLAEDSPTIRHHLKQIIESAPDMSVIGAARTGAEVIQLVEELRPDVVSMDINMPDVDGLEATRHIMSASPTPIVVVSGLLDTDVHLSLKAIEAGALAVIGKPPSQHDPTFVTHQRELLKVLRAMAGVKVISRRQLRYPNMMPSELLMDTGRSRRYATPELIAIGASTGGPSALLRLLSELPPTMSTPILIVQHMPDEFISGLAKWLTSATAQQVFVAKDQMALQVGMIFLAPGDAHIMIERVNDRLVTRLERKPKPSRYMPSIDVLFQSVAETLGNRAMGIILTGMGDDGAVGLKAMRDAGAITLAQDEASATVYGMPRAAIETNAATHIVALDNLATQIKKLL